MDEAVDFLEEILAEPDSDVPRLIYADWLEEQGSPRGEFIRVQCELDQLDRLDPRFIDLKWRNDELLNAHGRDWATEFQQDFRKASYTRGFIDTITLKARTFLKSGNELFRGFPVKWLRLNYIRGTSQQWAECDALQQLRYLDLAELKVPETDMLGLLSSPHLRNLRGLKIGGYEQEFSSDIARVLAVERISGSLEELYFAGEESAIQSLLIEAGNSVGLPSLQHLKLKAFSYEGRVVSEELSRVPFGVLQELDVDGPVTVADVRQMVLLPVDRLRRLRLTSVPAAGLDLLSEKMTLENVEQLELPYGDARLRAAQTLFRGEHLKKCHTLNAQVFSDFSSSGHADQFIQLLVSHAPLKALRSLRLSKLQEGHLKMLAESPHLENLQALHLSESELSVEDLRALANSHLSTSLRSLTLSQMCPSPQGFRELAAGQFSNLLQFGVDRRFTYGVDTKGIEEPIIEVLRSGAMPVLQSLSLTGLNLTKRTPYAVAEKAQLLELRLFYFDENTASNDVIGTILTSDRLPKLRLFSLKDCRGLRRSQKMADTYGARLQY